MDRKNHWEAVYTKKNLTGVSWYQEEPAVSLALIQKAGLNKDARIIDVGGGVSTLVDHLIRLGKDEQMIFSPLYFSATTQASDSPSFR